MPRVARGWLGAGRLACVFPALLAAGAAGGCGKSDVAKVREAVAAKFPGGRPRCMPLLREAVGIHVPSYNGVAPYYPPTGPTSPLRHLFVLYAAPSDAPVPEVVSLLSGDGILSKVTVQATVDAEATGQGPLVVSPEGWHSHPSWFRHDRRSFGVDAYLVADQDPRFAYDVYTEARFSNGTFPSLLYGGKLPPVDSHYVLPTRVPYALSVVSAACSTERVASVENVRHATLWNGMPVVWADVTWRQDVPDWMRTPAFSRAAVRGNTGSVAGLRRASTGFSIEGDGLSYVEEERP